MSYRPSRRKRLSKRKPLPYTKKKKKPTGFEAKYGPAVPMATGGTGAIAANVGASGTRYGFPKSMCMRMCAIYQVQYNAASFNEVMKLNDLYTPFNGMSTPSNNRSGHYSEAKAIYGRYRVHGGSVTISFGPTVANIVNMFTLVTASSTAPSNGIAFLTSGGRNFTLGSAGNRAVNVTIPFNCKRIAGVHSLDDDYAAAFDAVPTKPLYLHVRFECGANVTGYAYYTLKQKVVVYGEKLQEGE
jgi:hypothetical protein